MQLPMSTRMIPGQYFGYQLIRVDRQRAFAVRVADRNALGQLLHENGLAPGADLCAAVRDHLLLSKILPHSTHTAWFSAANAGSGAVPMRSGPRAASWYGSHSVDPLVPHQRFLLDSSAPAVPPSHRLPARPVGLHRHNTHS